MSTHGRRYGEWSPWAWNDQRQQWERSMLSRNGEQRTQYGQLPPPPPPQLDVPLEPNRPQYVQPPDLTRQTFPTRPLWERGQSGYKPTQPTQPLPAWSVPAPTTAPQASASPNYYPPTSPRIYDGPARATFANLGSNEQSPDFYNADDTTPNQSREQTRSAPAIDAQPNQGRDEDQHEPQDDYGSRAQTPRAVDHSSPAVVSSGPRRDNGRERSTAAGDRLVEDAARKLTGLGLTKPRRPSQSYHQEPRPGPKPPISSNQGSTRDPRSQSGTSRTRRSERTLSQSTTERPKVLLQQGGQDDRSAESGSSSKAKKRQSIIAPDVRSRPAENHSSRRERRDSIAQVQPDAKEAERGFQSSSRTLVPPKKQHSAPPPQRALEPKRLNGDILDSDYQYFHSRHFSPGGVFMTVWSEPMGGSGSILSHDLPNYTSPSKFGETAYHSIRRFAIVSAREGHCLCLPILTYGGQGTAKRGVKAEDHAIIYTADDDTVPVELPMERPLRKRPIRVAGRSPQDRLSAASRINYSKVYTIEHDIRVCFIGKIHKNSEAEFFADYRNMNN